MGFTIIIPSLWLFFSHFDECRCPAKPPSNNSIIPNGTNATNGINGSATFYAGNMYQGFGAVHGSSWPALASTLGPLQQDGPPSSSAACHDSMAKKLSLAGLGEAHDCKVRRAHSCHHSRTHLTIHFRHPPTICTRLFPAALNARGQLRLELHSQTAPLARPGLGHPPTHARTDGDANSHRRLASRATPSPDSLSRHFPSRNWSRHQSLATSPLARGYGQS